jgi:hypothetical protein
MIKYLNIILIIVFSALIVASVVIILVSNPAEPQIIEPETPDPIIIEKIIPPTSGLVIVDTPAQTDPGDPPGFPDPEANWVKLPDGPNIALGKTITSGDEHQEVYEPSNVLDGDLTSYWESRGVPATITIDLHDTYNIQTVAVRLNPAPIWEPRNQTFEVRVSADGINYTIVSPLQRHDFDPDSGNIVRIDFDAISARYVQMEFTDKSSGRSAGAQASEIEIFE